MLRGWYPWLVAAMQRAGPTFVKLGQWASTRPDFFPPAFCHELARLHSTVTAEPFAATQVCVPSETPTQASCAFARGLPSLS